MTDYNWLIGIYFFQNCQASLTLTLEFKFENGDLEEKAFLKSIEHNIMKLTMGIEHFHTEIKHDIQQKNLPYTHNQL